MSGTTPRRAPTPAPVTFTGAPAPLVMARLLGPNARAAGRVLLERQPGQRLRRLIRVASDSSQQSRRPSRPRIRSLWLDSAGRLAWRRMAAPSAPGPNGAVVEPLTMATCDMDRPLALGATAFPRPLHLGHECIARVAAVGDQVATVQPGDVVAVSFQISCGSCVTCRVGLSGSCRSVPPLSMYGFGAAAGAWGGTVADQVAVPYADAMLLPLPPGVDLVAAASVGDTLSDAYRHVVPHLSRLREHPAGSTVIILGALHPRSLYSPSVVFYAAQIVAALAPEAACMVADQRPWVRAEGERVGVEVVPLRALCRARAALVIDASFDRRGLATALRATAPDGLCSCAGTLHRSVRVPGALMYGRNVTLALSRSHIRAVMPHVLQLLAAGTIRPERVTNVVAGFADAPEVLRAHLRTATTKTVLVRHGGPGSSALASVAE